MPRKLLLLADDRCLDQLRDTGLFPDEIFRDAEARGAEAHEAIRIIRRDPSRFFVCERDEGQRAATGENAAGTLDEEGREELFVQLLGSVVCHLVLLEDAPEHRSRPRGSEEKRCRDLAHIPGLIEWYRRFQREARKCVGQHRSEYQHVLILICADDLKPDESEFKALSDLLFGEGEEKLVDAAYVMLRQLEPWGNDPAHARYVWPISVARLLPKILEEGIPQSNKTLVKAWRAFELGPEVDSFLIDEVLRRSLNKAYGTLAGATGPGAEDGQGTPFRPEPLKPGKIPLAKKPIREAPDWSTYPASEEVERIADPGRWEIECSEAGRKFALASAKDVVNWEKAVALEAAALWTRVHENPCAIASALARGDIALGSPIAIPMTRSGRNPDPASDRGPHPPSRDGPGSLWDAILNCERERITGIEQARGCATVLDEAQGCFLGIRTRIVFALVISAAVGYLSLIVAHGLLGWGWGMRTCLVFSGGLIGSALASILPYVLERKAGDRATRVFRESLAKIDRTTADRHERCQEWLANAHSVWQRLRATCVRERLRALLLRAQSMLDRELQPAPPVAEKPIPAEDERDEPDSRPQRERRRTRQRTTFLAHTRFRQEVKIGQLDEDRLRQVVESQIDSFQEQVWQPFCRRWDERFAGDLPARDLVPILKSFRESFCAAVVAEIKRQAITRVGPEAVRNWARKIREILDRNWWDYMSCMLGVTEMNKKLFASKLACRPGFSMEELRSECGSIVEFPCLRHLPAIGFFYQEAPIRLGLKDGILSVQPYEA